MEGEKIKVCAYCRVSTSSADQINSYDNQKAYFTELLQNDPNVEFCGIYADKGVSGTKLKRDGENGFDFMLRDAGLDIIDMTETNTDNVPKTFYVVALSNRQPKFNYIYVKNTSRFARNIEVMTIINKLVQKNVFIKFLDLNKCTENPEDITMIQLFLTFDENESRDKSRKVRFGQAQGLKKGTVYVNSRIYGYKYIKHENRLEIIPEEAEIIKEMFEMYAQGKGSRIIAQEFKKKGYKTRDDKDFSYASIGKKLMNEKYCGLNNPMRYETGTVFIDKLNYSKLKDEYDTFETDKIPPIISVELFKKCQEVLKGNRDFHNNIRGKYNGKTEMAGKIRCAHCNSFYHRQSDNNHRRNTSPEKSKEPYIWYRCGNKAKHGYSACQSKNLSQKRVDEVIQECIDGKLYTIIQNGRKNLFEKVMIAINDMLSNFNYDLEAEAKKINDEIVEIDNQLENAYMQLLNKPSDKLQQIIEKLEERLALLKERSAEVMEDNNKLGDEIMEFFNAYKFAVENLPTQKEFTREEVLDAVSYFWVYEGKFVDVQLKASEWLSELYIKYDLDHYYDVVFSEETIQETIKEVFEKMEKLYNISVKCQPLFS